MLEKAFAAAEAFFCLATRPEREEIKGDRDLVITDPL
jgi:hypothetical protein